MKTSIVAVIAASLFLAAAYLGLGSRPGAAPAAPQMIAIAGPASDAGTPAAADLPLTLPSSPAASQVLAVGRQVVPGSLKDLAGRAPTSGGPVDTAAGPPAATDQQVNASINATVEPLPRSAPGATPPASTVGKPGPTPYPTYVPPTHRPPRPEPSPTPQPIPTPQPSPSPTPTPTPVTPTVTPPVTSTASSSSPTPPPHP